MQNEPNLFSYSPKKRARKTDPTTSKVAAAAHRWTRTNHKLILLRVYADTALFHTGLSDREAFSRSDLPAHCCWWKRCSELRELGMIQPVGTEHCETTGSLVQLCRITGLGRQQLETYA